MTSTELHNDDPVDSVGRGITGVMGGIGDMFNSAVGSMDDDPAARGIGKWVSFGMAFLVGNHYMGQGASALLNRIPGLNALPDWAKNIASGAIGMGGAFALASGLSSWFANSRDTSELGQYLREGFTDTIDMARGIFGATGISNLFNNESDPDTATPGLAHVPTVPVPNVPAVTATPVALTATQMTPQILDAAQSEYGTAALALRDDDNELTNFTIPVEGIDARIETVQATLRTVVEGQGLDFMGGNFQVFAPEAGSSAYRMVPIGSGDPVTITQEQYEAIQPALETRNTTIEALNEFKEDIAMHNQLAVNTVNAFYEFNTALEAAGLPYGAGEVDMSKIVASSSGEYYYDLGDGEGIHLEGLTEAGFTNLQTLHTRFTDSMGAYNDKVDALQARTDLPEGVTMGIAEGPTADVETFYDAPTQDRVVAMTL